MRRRSAPRFFFLAREASVASASDALFFLGILHVFFVFLRKMRDGLVTVW